MKLKKPFSYSPALFNRVINRPYKGEELSGQLTIYKADQLKVKQILLKSSWSKEELEH